MQGTVGQRIFSDLCSCKYLLVGFQEWNENIDIFIWYRGKLTLKKWWVGHWIYYYDLFLLPLHCCTSSGLLSMKSFPLAQTLYNIYPGTTTIHHFPHNLNTVGFKKRNELKITSLGRKAVSVYWSLNLCIFYETYYIFCYCYCKFGYMIQQLIIK